MLYSNELKILADENVPIKITKLLIQKGFNVKKVPFGLKDKQISEIAKKESRIILTFDKHFINK